jgi:hypothetical protein
MISKGLPEEKDKKLVSKRTFEAGTTSPNVGDFLDLQSP